MNAERIFPDWRALERPGVRAGAALLVWALVLQAFFLVATHRSVASSAETATEPGLLVEDVDTKLFILIIDSLRPDNAAALPFLEPYVSAGFSTVMEPCIDRLTIPCLKEAFNGAETFGLDGVIQNMVTSDRASSSNLFADIQASGRRIGVIHMGELESFSDWFDLEYTAEEERPATAARWISEGVDVIVYDYTAFDSVSHRKGAGTWLYRNALKELNKEVTPLLEQLGPEYEVVVFGDHGHTDTGRHIQGLDVPTMFFSSGATFGPGELEERISLSSVRYLIGARLGILPPTHYQGADLADRLAPDTALRRAADAQRFTPQSRSRGFVWWGILPVIGLLVLAARAAPPRWAAGVAGAGALAFLAGCGYIPMVSVVHYNKAIPIGLPVIAAGMAALAWLVGRMAGRGDRGLFAALAVMMVALPGTTYAYGLYQSVVPLIAVAAAALLLPRAYAARDRGALLPILVLVVTIVLLWDVVVINFAIQRYKLIAELPSATGALLWAGLAALTLPGPAHTGRRAAARISAGIVAGVGALGLIALPALVTAPLTAACLVVALKRPAWLPLVAAWAVPLWYSPADAAGIACCVGLAWSVARLTPAAWSGRDAFLPLIILGLAYVSFTFSIKLRIVGIDFTYATRWFSGDWHEKLWLVIALAVVIKVAVPIVMIAHAVQRVGPVRARPIATLAALTRLACGTVFVLGMIVTAQDIPRFRLLDLLEDNAMVWTVLLALSVFCLPDRPAPRTPAP